MFWAPGSKSRFAFILPNFWPEYYEKRYDCLVSKSTVSTLNTPASHTVHMLTNKQTNKQTCISLTHLGELWLHTELLIIIKISLQQPYCFRCSFSSYSMPIRFILSSKLFWLEGIKYIIGFLQSELWWILGSQNSVTEKRLINCFFISRC